jgi:hypothetical protein
MLRAEETRSRWLGMDMRPRWRRRVAVLVTYFLFLVAIGSSGAAWWGHPIAGAVTLVCTVWWLGVFGSFGPMKDFEGQQRNFGGWILVNGLDAWARYKFGAPSFDEASEPQKEELLRNYRFGNFYMPMRWPQMDDSNLDERELRERDGAARWAMRWVGMFMACAVGTYANARRPVDGMEVAAELLSLLVLLWTLPQARVLWTEPDPREMSGEMELVGREA